ncbi:STAS domain-containing protein [Nonomuraea sp. SYSU D8015]|uniref:STAS domain-containing protein n=1 Tax=Nonomuraea sp. SYSU D8015 TaxID=2593644 RepID=UPI001661637A|nr:STAS domain-containing protein [Nonomuraea sp. SYSU D8015]
MTFPTGGDDHAEITAVAHPCGLRISGEIDRQTRPRLARALAWAVAACKGDIRLDLGGLNFIDTAGLQLIAGVAAELPAPRRLILDPVPPMARKLLGMLGWRLSGDMRLYTPLNGQSDAGPHPTTSGGPEH